MLLLGTGHCFRDHVLEVCPEYARFSSDAEGIRKSFEGSSLETIKYMVASGMGVTVVPQLSVPADRSRTWLRALRAAGAHAPRGAGLAAHLHALRGHRGAAQCHLRLPLPGVTRLAGAQRCLLLRVRRAEPSALDAPATADFIGQTPDAVVVTDASGRLLWANPAFLELCQAPEDHRLKGRNVADLLGDPQRQWPPLLARVRARGIVGRASITLGLPGGTPVVAEVSAALLAEGDQEHIGFTLRLLPGTAGERAAQELALDVSALTTQLGHAPLAELLAEASSATVCVQTQPCQPTPTAAHSGAFNCRI
jgi:PAS domain-containing protein